jgi:hypothetical protein
VVIDGAEPLAAPPDALMGFVVSTLKYALIPPTTREDETVKRYGPGSAPALPATFQYVDIARFCPLLVVLRINVQPEGPVIVGGPLEPCAVIVATMTSLASVPAGLPMLSDVALLAVPLLALEVSRNPMNVAPGQVSARSQSFAAGRHTAPGLPGGCVQLMLAPSQMSVVHGSASAVQAVPLGLNGFAGQVVLVPLQVAGRSHSPAAARHTVPAFPAGCWQLLLVPLHWSSVQGFVSAVQEVPDGFLASEGQDVLDPSQLSDTSHSPAAVRQMAPAFPAGC